MASYCLLLLMLKIENLDPRNKLRAIPRFPAGSFAVHIGDHLRFGIICGPIWGSLLVWGSFAVGDHFWRCTKILLQLLACDHQGHLLQKVEFQARNSSGLYHQPKFESACAK